MRDAGTQRHGGRLQGKADGGCLGPGLGACPVGGTAKSGPRDGSLPQIYVGTTQFHLDCAINCEACAKNQGLNDQFDQTPRLTAPPT